MHPIIEKTVEFLRPFEWKGIKAGDRGLVIEADRDGFNLTVLFRPGKVIQTTAPFVREVKS